MPAIPAYGVNFMRVISPKATWSQSMRFVLKSLILSFLNCGWMDSEIHIKHTNKTAEYTNTHRIKNVICLYIKVCRCLRDLKITCKKFQINGNGLHALIRRPIPRKYLTRTGLKVCLLAMGSTLFEIIAVKTIEEVNLRTNLYNKLKTDQRKDLVLEISCYQVLSNFLIVRLAVSRHYISIKTSKIRRLSLWTRKDYHQY